MKLKSIVLAVPVYVMIVGAVFLLASSVYGQTQNIGKVPESLAATKVATVDLRSAIVGTADGQQASKDLQIQFSAVIGELQQLNQKVNDLKARLADPKTAEAEKANLTQELNHIGQTLDNKNKHVEEDIKAAQSDVVIRIGKGLIEVIDSYAKDNGYTAVLDSSATSSQLLFVSPSIDITKDVVKLYDQKHPAKTPAASQK